MQHDFVQLKCSGFMFLFFFLVIKSLSNFFLFLLFNRSDFDVDTVE